MKGLKIISFSTNSFTPFLQIFQTVEGSSNKAKFHNKSYSGSVSNCILFSQCSAWVFLNLSFLEFLSKILKVHARSFAKGIISHFAALLRIFVPIIWNLNRKSGEFCLYRSPNSVRSESQAILDYLYYLTEHWFTFKCQFVSIQYSVKLYSIIVYQSVQKITYYPWNLDSLQNLPGKIAVQWVFYSRDPILSVICVFFQVSVMHNSKLPLEGAYFDSIVLCWTEEFSKKAIVMNYN